MRLPILLVPAASLLIASCTGDSGRASAETPGGIASECFKLISLPEDAEIHAELSQPDLDHEMTAFLCFTTGEPLEDLKAMFDVPLLANGWAGLYSRDGGPYWDETMTSVKGSYRRDESKDRLVVMIHQQQVRQTMRTIVITPSGVPPTEREEPEDKPETVQRTVSITYRKPLTDDEELAARYTAVAATRPHDIGLQYVTAQHLLNSDPAAAVEIGKRLAGQDPNDWNFLILIARGLEAQGEAGKSEAIDYYEKALQMLRYSGKLNIEENVETKISELSGAEQE